MSFIVTLPQMSIPFLPETQEFDDWSDVEDCVEEWDNELQEESEVTDLIWSMNEMSVINGQNLLCAHLRKIHNPFDLMVMIEGEDVLTNSEVESIWEEAIENFPHELETTSCEMGGLERDSLEDDIEYSVEYTFDYGQLGDEPLVAGGWIDIRIEGDEVMFSALFSVARNGDWSDDSMRIFRDCEGLQGWYDRDTGKWDLEMGFY